MASDRGQNNLSSLIESLPGIASVLRSPVADGIVGMIRAAVGIEDFSDDHAQELIRYAVRRGLIGSEEGDRVLAEVERARSRRRRATRATRAKRPSRPSRPKKAVKRPKKAAAKPQAKKSKKATRKSAKSSAKKTAKGAKHKTRRGRR